jgi:fused signal recognition particle receptor
MVVTLVIVLAVAFVVLAGAGGLVMSRTARRRRGPEEARRPAVDRRPGAPPKEAPRPAEAAGEAEPAVLAPEVPGPGLPAPGVPAPGVPAPGVPAPGVAAPEVPGPGAPAPEVAAPEIGPRPRFRDRLGKARSLLAGQLAGLRGRSRVDEEAWEDLEEALILADVGVETTAALLERLRKRAREDHFDSPEQLMAGLREELVERLEGDRELHRAGAEETAVWLFVGVNGVGKTTTIGKVAMRELSEGRGAVMAAGDTFRAAAADQLQLWAERVGAGFVRGNEGGDPGAVVFDAVQHATARGIPLVLADTAGRLHTKVNLMEELKKVRRVAARPPGAVTEVLLVIDATTGQNGLVQARQFTDAVGVTGVVLTKLDGTAKGGIAIAIASELGVPIKLVGLGEKPEDLVSFDAQEFVDALLG